MSLAIEILLQNFIDLTPESIMRQFLEQKKVEHFILELEKDRLFTFGEDSKGKTLGQYAESTKQRKRAQGLPSGHITLYDTGDFYSSFTLKLTDDGFILDAKGQKESVNLFEKYGNDILGLSEEDFEKFIDYATEQFKIIIEDEIFKGL